MSRRDGSWRRWRWAWCWALVAWLCWPFVLPAQPQESSGRPPSALLQSIETRLTAIVAYSTQLEAKLTTSETSLGEATMRLGQLQSELSGLRAELESWQAHSADLASRAETLQGSLAALETRLGVLSASYATSERSWRLALEVAEKDARRRSLERWLWAGVALAVGAAVGFGVALAIP